MMSFFPGSFCAPAQSPAAEVSYAPLFRLLEDYDNYSREAKAAAPSAPAARRQRTRQPRPQPATFKPAFDVRETEHTYELYGELPGLARENVNIEFTEPQTLVISGRVERNYHSAANANNTNTDTANNDNDSAVSDAPSTEDFTEIEKPRRNSYKATVEDDPEDENSTPATTPAASPKMEVAAPVKSQQSQEAVTQKRPAHDEPKYHLLERSVGEFSRAFTFPARVDYDGVAASLDNGILAVTVPKAKPMLKKIEIRV